MTQEKTQKQKLEETLTSLAEIQARRSAAQSLVSQAHKKLREALEDLEGLEKVERALIVRLTNEAAHQ